MGRTTIVYAVSASARVPVVLGVRVVDVTRRAVEGVRLRRCASVAGVRRGGRKRQRGRRDDGRLFVECGLERRLGRRHCRKHRSRAGGRRLHRPCERSAGGADRRGDHRRPAAHGHAAWPFADRVFVRGRSAKRRGRQGRGRRRLLGDHDSGVRMDRDEHRIVAGRGRWDARVRPGPGVVRDRAQHEGRCA